MEPTDFQKITKDLREAGYSDVFIAKLCGCKKQYIWKMRHGHSGKISHQIGSKLTKLHEAL